MIFYYRWPLQNDFLFVLKYVQFHDIFLYVQILSVFVPLYPQTTSAFIQKYNGFYIVIFLEHREIYQLFTFHEFNFLFKFCEIKTSYLFFFIQFLQTQIYNILPQ